MKVRPVTLDDRDEWVRMRNTLHADCPPEEIDDWFERADKGGTHLVGVAVFVAVRRAGGLAGFVEVGVRNYAEGCETSPVAFIEGWYVDPDVRQSGLGGKLIDAAENWARAEGSKR